MKPDDDISGKFPRNAPEWLRNKRIDYVNKKRDEGLTDKAIAQSLGISNTSLSEWMAIHALPRRHYVVQQRIDKLRGV